MALEKLNKLITIREAEPIRKSKRCVYSCMRRDLKIYNFRTEKHIEPNVKHKHKKYTCENKTNENVCRRVRRTGCKEERYDGQ